MGLMLVYHVKLRPFPVYESLRGKVCQVGLTESIIVKGIIGNDVNYNRKNIWTAFRMNGHRLRPCNKSPYNSVLEMLVRKEEIDVAIFDAVCHDLGFIDGEKKFFSHSQTTVGFHSENGSDANLQ